MCQKPAKAVKVESDGCLKRAKKVMTSIAFATFSSVTDFSITKSLDKIKEVTLERHFTPAQHRYVKKFHIMSTQKYLSAAY